MSLQLALAAMMIHVCVFRIAEKAKAEGKRSEGDRNRGVEKEDSQTRCARNPKYLLFIRVMLFSCHEALDNARVVMTAVNHNTMTKGWPRVEESIKF